MTRPINLDPQTVTVFYDGSCPLCTAEIGHYKRADCRDALTLVDVSSDDFTGDGEITRQEAMSRFHVRLADGRQVSGARGFVEVWRVVPSWSWLARLARGPGILPALELLYRFFLRVRPLTVYLFKGCRRVISRQQSE